MRVLMLSNNWEVAAPVRDFLDEREHLITGSCDINERRVNADILVSYCYRTIIKPETLRRYAGAVNLHNSYLPWGRGAQPLFWSVIDDEPCGVSIHWMDSGVDTGEVIARQPVGLHEDMTFRQAYEAQHRCLALLFEQHWEYIRQSVGTHHTVKEFEAVESILGREGWDCTIAEARRRWRA